MKLASFLPPLLPLPLLFPSFLPFLSFFLSFFPSFLPSFLPPSGQALSLVQASQATTWTQTMSTPDYASLSGLNDIIKLCSMTSSKTCMINIIGTISSIYSLMRTIMLMFTSIRYNIIYLQTMSCSRPQCINSPWTLHLHNCK